MDTNTTHYILGFSPAAEQRTAHHMLLFGCREPGQRESLFRWVQITTRVLSRVTCHMSSNVSLHSCGEMGIVLPGTKQSSPCRSGKQASAIDNNFVSLSGNLQHIISTFTTS